jgi:hypothetical protein
MTTLLVVLYAVVMISGIYGLVLQHQLPHIMKERLPAETVYEQIPHIRAQLVAAAEKMRDSFKPSPPEKTDAGAPAPSAAKTVTAESTPMASTSGELSTPTARAKSVVGSTITAQTVPPTSGTPAAPGSSTLAKAMADKPSPAPAPSPPAATTSAKPEAASDTVSQSVLLEFVDEQVLPYLSARRGDRFRLGTSRYSEELFRFVKLRVSEAHRARVEEIQAWCDERRMLDLQLKLQHWLHGWLFVHVPISFLLILLTGWHAYVTLFYY